MKTLRQLLLVAGIAAAAAAPMAAQAYDDWFVFGDSLSDTGNNAIFLGIDADQVITGNTYIPTYPYASGRYSNADVWTTRFAQTVGLPALASLSGGNLYAYGGARTRIVGPDGTPPLLDQVAAYLAATGGVADPNALYVIEGGGNNARDTLEAIATGDPLLRTLLGNSLRYVADEKHMVDALQAAGARHIIVWNTPDISKAPAVIAEGPAAVALAERVVGSMNKLLERRLASEPGVQIFDVYGLFDGIIANPGAYGLVNATDACGAIVGCDPSTYLFWDGIHPTSAGHTIISEAMVAAAVPEPATLWMFGIGSVVLIAWRRRPR